MGGKIAFILIAIVVAGLVLYAYNANLGGQATNFFKSLSPAASTSTPVQTSSPGSQTGPSYTPPPQQTVIAPTPTSSINPANIPAGFTAAQLSPYFGQVRFGGVSPSYGSAYSGSYGQISLYANPPEQSSTIDVTGWEIKTNAGGEYVPQAVAAYDPSGLAPASDIRLKSGDSLTLYSSFAPVNLRLNACMAYFPDRAQFNPQLPNSCPYNDNSAAQNFTGACQNYIQSLGSCGTPNLSDPRIPQNDYNCISYLQHNFSYLSCFNAHRTDPNFLSNQVWVWMGASPLDLYHDRVLLLDRNNLLVDIYKY
jgi:hypothetical protein